MVQALLASESQVKNESLQKNNERMLSIVLYFLINCYIFLTWPIKILFFLNSIPQVSHYCPNLGLYKHPAGLMQKVVK